jgi:cell division protein FtsB
VRRFLLPALLLVAAYYAVFGGEYTMGDVNRTRALAAGAQAELVALQAETARLERRVEALEHDPRALEALARERFGLIREGEILYRFADGGSDAAGKVDSDESGR